MDIAVADRFRAIIFEPAGMIYDDSAWQRWLLQVLARMGLQTQYQPFFRLFETEFLSESYCGRRDFWESWREFLLRVGLHKGQIDELAIAAQAKRAQYENDLRPMPGVSAALTLLHARGATLLALANTTDCKRRFMEKLHRLSIAQRIKSAVTSRDLGWAMPDSKCYLAAVEEIRMPRSEILFVSADSRTLEGAMKVGIRTATLRSTAQVADITVDRLDELAPMLQATDGIARRQLIGNDLSFPRAKAG
jgi:FMN phosphatase YigB (HAD superfamily)